MTNTSLTFEIRVTPRPTMLPEIEIYRITSKAPLYTCEHLVSLGESGDRNLPRETKLGLAILERETGVRLTALEAEYREVEGYDALERALQELIVIPADSSDDIVSMRDGIIEATLRRIYLQTSTPEDFSRPGVYL